VPPPDVSSLPAGQLLLTVSGEALATTGYAFPPADPAMNPAFVDGWEVHFDYFLTTFDKITLSTSPDTAPGDQAQTGPLVAELDGPWAVNIARDDPSYLVGKEKQPPERAVPFAVLTGQNKNGDRPFATDGTRYAGGFDAVAATSAAQNVNLDARGLSLYSEMIGSQCVVLYVGTATYKGQNCTPADPEFGRLPGVVNFHLCYKTPTTYSNCQNQDNDPAMAVPGEIHQRGVAFLPNQATVGEVTFHTDHPFWESTKHDTPAHFDPFAALAVGKAGSPPTVTLEDAAGVDFTAFSDTDKRPLPWRSCLPPAVYMPPGAGQMHFDPVAVPVVGPNGDPARGLRDFYDFSTYNQSTQGHWNGADGLCVVTRHYPSPP